jgi:predicted ribosomally synthesized peptide with SipW-like signal peptide
MLKHSKRLASFAIVIGVVSLLTVGTLALYTDQESITANTFSTGTIDLTVSPTSALVTFTNMMPGDTYTDDLTVSNAGSEALRYAISSVATNADSKGFKDQLALTVKTVDATTPASPCNEFDGTELYTGDLDSSAGKIIGDAASGQDGVDASGGDRPLASSASEILCFRASLPSATGNTFQGSATTATFTFDAEQTKNN